MKIQYFPYELIFKSHESRRVGALFRFQFNEGVGVGVGAATAASIRFGDLLPWPEYGGKSLDEEIIDIKAGRYSQVFLRTIQMAKMFETKDLNKNTNHFFNHFLISDISNISLNGVKMIEAQGYSILKIKVGRNIDAEVVWLNQMALEPLRFRLDFNSKLSLQQFTSFFDQLLPEVKKKIDFAEDPMPYQEQDWLKASQITTLAADFAFENWEKTETTSKSEFLKNQKVPFRVIVLKPARQDIEKIILKTLKLNVNYVVTSSMDAVLGEQQAQAMLPDLKKKLGSRLLTSGCETRHLFEDHPLFHCNNLEELPWKSIG